MKVIMAVFSVAAISIYWARLSIEGLGKSAVTCADKDGGGCGIGTGAIGRAANDNDANVRRAAEAIAASGSVPNTCTMRGYRRTRYWIIDSVNGNDSTGKVCTPSTFGACLPYLTWSA
jgi:hypothetical protein